MGRLLERFKRFLFKDVSPRQRDDQQHVMDRGNKEQRNRARSSTNPFLPDSR